MSEVIVYAFLVVAFFGVMLLLFAILKMWQTGKQRTPKSKDDIPVWPYQTMPIMTDSEVLFFKKLKQAMPEYLIFCQVQLSRIIEPNEDAEDDRKFWFNRVCRQSVDYVLVGDDLQTVLIAIELDDWTHHTLQREKQDAKKDKALASAGIPIIRFHSEGMPSSPVIRAEILKVMEAYPI